MKKQEYENPFTGWRGFLKRGVDLLGATFGLIFLAPVFLIIAFLIKWDSKGPVFAKIRQRVGMGGEEFFMYKFRSMIKGADKYKEELLHLNEREEGDGPLFKIENDPRITKVGEFLRATRLDELPQLINVLKGEMSLVGPRAHEPQEVAQYDEEEKKVLNIKPGMSGLAQIHGAEELPFEEENKLDRKYIKNWSLFLDLKILAKTIIFVFTNKGN